MLKRKGGWKRRGQYDVQIKRVDGEGRELGCANEKVDRGG